MKLEHFSIEVADWSHERDRQALLDIRAQVFIVEQGVPEQRERPDRFLDEIGGNPVLVEIEGSMND